MGEFEGKARYYRFVGRSWRYETEWGVYELPYRIPYGAVVKLIRWFPRRKVMVEYRGENILTMGYLLRKVRDPHGDS